MPEHAHPASAVSQLLRSHPSDGLASAAQRPVRMPLGPIVDRELAACRRSGTSLVLLCIGIVDLHAVGQRHGDEVEQQLRHAVWSRLKHQLRGTDLAVCVADDEFGAILPNAAWPAAAIVDARVCRALTQPYGIGTLEIAIAVRTGVAVFPRAGTTGEALVAAAEQARAIKAAMA
jgi:predicted signal transduction protein with EAL and GGDEF domain